MSDNYQGQYPPAPHVNSNAPYQQPAPFGQVPQQEPPFNLTAAIGFGLSFVVNIVGAIVCMFALKQIKKTGERGKGLAIAGIVIGLVSFVASILFIVGTIIGIAAMDSASSTYATSSASSSTSAPATASETDSAVDTEPATAEASNVAGSDEPIGEYCAAIIGFQMIAGSDDSNPESIIASFEALRDTTPNPVVKEQTQNILTAVENNDEAAFDEATAILTPELQKDSEECLSRG